MCRFATDNWLDDGRTNNWCGCEEIGVISDERLVAEIILVQRYTNKQHSCEEAEIYPGHS